MDQIETSIRKKAFSDAGITEQQKQQSLLKSAANPSVPSSSTGSNTAAAAASSSESADVDVEGLADTKIEEKV